MDKPIRVLCVFARLDRGGAESMCMNLYRKIDRTKVQFDFVKHTETTGDFEEEINLLGGRVYTAPRFKIYNYISYAKWWCKHLKAHPEHRIVHGHFFTIAAVYFRFAHWFGRATVGHSHSTGQTMVGVKSWLKKWLQNKIEGASDHRLACSEAAGKWLFPHRDYHVLLNAIHTERFSFNQDVCSQTRAQFGLTDRLVLGTVANYSEPKNPFGLIEIFESIHKKDPNARLLWVGDGSLRGAIETQIREKGLEEAVILTGVRSDVDRLMQAMDVFLLPSLWEGLPVVLVEAQAAGLPCLVSDTVTREADITGLCTFLPLGDSERWAREAEAAAKTERKDTSRQIAEAGYDIQTTAKWLEEFYLNCEKKQKEL